MNSEGLVKLERVEVVCPGCGRRLLAVTSEGRGKGYCAISRQRVDFVAETQCIGKNPAKIKKRWQDGVVSDYLRGDKISVIQLRYGVSPGVMYRILHASHVELRTDRKPRQ